MFTVQRFDHPLLHVVISGNVIHLVEKVKFTHWCTYDSSKNVTQVLVPIEKGQPDIGIRNNIKMAEALYKHFGRIVSIEYKKDGAEFKVAIPKAKS